MKIDFILPEDNSAAVQALVATLRLAELRPEWELRLRDHFRADAPCVEALKSSFRVVESASNADLGIFLRPSWRVVPEIHSYLRLRRLGVASPAANIVFHDYDRVPRSCHALTRSHYYFQIMRLAEPSLQTYSLKRSASQNPAVERIALHLSAEIVLKVGRNKIAELSRLAPCELVIEGGDPQVKDLKRLLSDVHFDREFVLETAEQAIALSERATHYLGQNSSLAHFLACRGLAGFCVVQNKRNRIDHPVSADMRVATLNELHALISKPEELFSTVPVQRTPVSAFIISKNEEQNIGRALESVQWCDDIVLVDSGSTDRTVQIAEELGARVLHQPWLGHRRQKQFALEQCKHEWVLNIDSDEEVSPELRLQLESILSQPERLRRANGYLICRVMFHLGCWWQKGGWHPEYRLRFMRRESARWGGTDPHEKAVVVGKLRKLEGYIYHYSFQDLKHQVDTTNRFTSLMASTLFAENKRFSLFYLFLSPPARFVKIFLLKKGYRLGLRGFIISVLEAFQAFIKHAKLWEQENVDYERDRSVVEERAANVIPLDPTTARKRKQLDL